MINSQAYQTIFLWRHADAEPISVDAPTDIQRQLTALGKQQAKQMAAWLTPQLPANITVLSSPAKRTLQTVEPLGKEITIVKQLAPGNSLLDVLDGLRYALSNATISQNLLIVGHQPWIGQLADFLEHHATLTPDNTQMVTDQSFRKAAVLCFRKPLAETSALFERYHSQSPETLNITQN